MIQNQKDNNTDIIVGRNAVLEALRAQSEIDSVMVAKGDRQGSIAKIVAICRERGIPVKEVSPEKLAHLSQGEAHQGVAAVIAAVKYVQLSDILAKAKEEGTSPFVIIADGIEDPHNLGALIRTAEAAGAHGIVIPKRRSASVTAAVYKASAGACAHLPVARVANIATALDELKQNGVWIYGADMGGSMWCEQDYSGGVGLVIGSEGEGLSRLVKDKCDFIISLPMLGKVSSLNASVAGGILMYEVARQRNDLKSR